MKTTRCATCGKKAHNFETEEALNCVAPQEVLIFSQFEIDKGYRDALYHEYPMYTSEEVVGSYLGHNPSFPGQTEWFEKQADSEEE